MRPPTPGSPTPPSYPCLCVPMPAFCRDSPMIPMWKPTPSHRWRLWMMWSLLMMKCSLDARIRRWRGRSGCIRLVFDAGGGIWAPAACRRTSIYVCGAYPCARRCPDDLLRLYGRIRAGPVSGAERPLAPLSHPISGLKCMTRSKPVTCDIGSGLCGTAASRQCREAHADFGARRSDCPSRRVLYRRHAAAYGDAVVGEAWQTPITQTDAAVELPWPATLSDAVHEQLSRGIDVIAADSSSLEQHQDAGPLLQRAQLLVDDADLMADAASGQSLDEAVKAKAQRILAAGRQNVTSLKARVGGMSEREERLYWRSIIRPIPRISSPAAEAGTQFHAWAEQFINAGKPDEAVLAYETEIKYAAYRSGCGIVFREAMLADLAERERQCRKPSTRQPAVPQPTAQQSASAVSAPAPPLP